MTFNVLPSPVLSFFIWNFFIQYCCSAVDKISTDIPYILAYKPTIFGLISTFKLWGSLIRGSCHTARVDSQHDGYLSATLTVCVPHTAWTISRSPGGYVDAWGEHVGRVLNDHAHTYAAAAVTWVLDTILTLRPCKAIVQWSWDQRRRRQHPSN